MKQEITFKVIGRYTLPNRNNPWRKIKQGQTEKNVRRKVDNLIAKLRDDFVSGSQVNLLPSSYSMLKESNKARLELEEKKMRRLI